MAKQYGDSPLQQAQEDEYAYRKGTKKRWQQKMEDLVSGRPYDAAAQAAKDAARQRGAEALATSQTRNIGATTDVAARMAGQAATSMMNLELDKSQAAIGGLEALQQADTTQSEQDKKRREYEVAIRDYARKSGKLGMGVWGEQEDTAAWVDALAASETDRDLKLFLEKKAFAIRGGGNWRAGTPEGEFIAEWDV